MNDDDEAEYAPYYDYARQYENMGLLPKLEAPKEMVEEEDKGEKEEGDGWEDVLDDADIESGEEEVVDHEDLEVVVEEESNKTEDKEESSGISEVDKTNTPNESIADKIGNSESSIADKSEDVPSKSSFSLEAVLKRRQGKGGMTRVEAFNALSLEKPEMLSTGEIKLASGKIIGHRQYARIYRQRYYRTPDDREAVIINKLAIQYRKKKGGPLALGSQAKIASGHMATYKEQKRITMDKHWHNEHIKKFYLDVGMRHNKTKMTFFRLASNV